MKKKRALNFSSKEENVLIALRKEKYASQIEIKKNDANKLKTEAWLRLAKEFNSQCGDSYRDAKEEKKYLYGTGGGTPINTTTTDIDNEIKEITGSQMTGFVSEFDTDREDVEMEQDQVVLIVENDDGNACYTEIDWSKYTPQMLRTPESSELKSNKGRRENALKTKLGIWTQSKQQLVTAQEKSHVEEHLLKLRHMEEKHQASLRHDQECHDEKMKMYREHEKKLQILQLQWDKLMKET